MLAQTGVMYLSRSFSSGASNSSMSIVSLLPILEEGDLGSL
jgi:hypothetical protein